MREDEWLVAWAELRQVTSRLWVGFNRRLEEEAGIYLLEHELMYQLTIAPERRLRMLDLAELLNISKSGVTRLVDRLAERGWVRRESAPNDRRTIYTMLTSEGVQVFPRNRKAFIAAFDELFGSRLTTKDLLDLRRVLAKLLD